ncbi:MAG: hypothetical protein OEZ48_00565 [Candidatus Bathyarchaeota archaeon]|nr:hypothetical protein [Candidatus Bathyarchaeota archaeon]
MEYRTVSTKLPSNELTLFRAHCEKKGVTPASLIRELILGEMKITVPHTISGRNKIQYDRKMDAFAWSVELDDGEQIEVLRSISPHFIEDLNEILSLGLQERSVFINRKKKDSVSVPSNIIRREE